MTDENQAVEQTENTAADNRIDPDEIKRVYFAPNELETKGAEYLNRLFASVSVKSNIDFIGGETVPENFGIFVAPMRERAKTKGEKSKFLFATACVVPDLSLLMSRQDGREYVQDAVNAKFFQKISVALKPNSRGETNEGSLPKSLDDFVSSRAENLGAFSDYAPKLVDALKAKGFTWMTPVILRRCFQSKAYASGFSISDETWVAILDGLITRAQKEGKDASSLMNWKATRDEAQVNAAEDLDDDDLADLIAA